MNQEGHHIKHPLFYWHLFHCEHIGLLSHLSRPTLFALYDLLGSSLLKLPHRFIRKQLGAKFCFGWKIRRKRSGFNSDWFSCGRGCMFNSCLYHPPAFWNCWCGRQCFWIDFPSEKAVPRSTAPACGIVGAGSQTVLGRHRLAENLGKNGPFPRIYVLC